MKTAVAAFTPRYVKHRWRNIDPIDDGSGTILQPRADPPGSTGKIKSRSMLGPVDRQQPIEQAQIHLVLHNLLVSAYPFAVAFRHFDDWVFALIIDGVVHRLSLLAWLDMPGCGQVRFIIPTGME